MFPKVIKDSHDTNVEYLEYYLRRAKTLNGFFMTNRIREYHEDLNTIAMYLSIQITKKMITQEDIDELLNCVKQMAKDLEGNV